MYFASLTAFFLGFALITRKSLSSQQDDLFKYIKAYLPSSIIIPIIPIVFIRSAIGSDWSFGICLISYIVIIMTSLYAGYYIDKQGSRLKDFIEYFL